MADIYAQIAEAVEAYTLEVKNEMERLSSKTARNCAKDLNAASAQFGEGRYSTSWKATMDGSEWVVHSKVPGLPHLLESGHVHISHGTAVGNVAGRVHIAPIAEIYKTEFVNSAKAVVGK